MAGVKVVLFDLDDTLFAHSAAVAAGVTAHRRALGGAIALADDAAELRRWHDLEEHHYHRYLDGEIGFIDQRIARATDFAAPFGVALSPAQAHAWYDQYFAEYRLAWRLHDDTVACLDAMPDARFGIITNGELDFQLPKLEAIGLLPRMEHVIASGDVGFTKPDARIFRHACNLFGIAPSEAAYVGDRFETDAMGAASAGLTGVWLDRTASATAFERAAARSSGVHIVTTLSDVPALLAG